MERKVGEVIKLEKYGEKHLSDFFEDADELEDNDYIRGCYRPGDIIDDCSNTLEYIIEALDFVTRPELKEIMESIYSDEYISMIKKFVQDAKDFQGWY